MYFAVYVNADVPVHNLKYIRRDQEARLIIQKSKSLEEFTCSNFDQRKGSIIKPLTTLAITTNLLARR
jgi:hypothetical protein